MYAMALRKWNNRNGKERPMNQTAEKLDTLPQAGQSAPDFSMPADNGGTVSLKDFASKQNIVLYFYPKDDTPGCTTEAKDFRDLVKDFAFEDTTIIGVSKNSIASHCKFRDKYELNFALASDEQSDVCERYGVAPAYAHRHDWPAPQTQRLDTHCPTCQY